MGIDSNHFTENKKRTCNRNTGHPELAISTMVSNTTQNELRQVNQHSTAGSNSKNTTVPPTPQSQMEFNRVAHLRNQFEDLGMATATQDLIITPSLKTSRNRNYQSAQKAWRICRKLNQALSHRYQRASAKNPCGSRHPIQATFLKWGPNSTLSDYNLRRKLVWLLAITTFSHSSDLHRIDASSLLISKNSLSGNILGPKER
ncbi:hypothetical protein FBU30_001618 [Linnemannia zychae]|nr:hypothetical protein FBU30_001618 [Linnemannia zychae]